MALRLAVTRMFFISCPVFCHMHYSSCFPNFPESSERASERDGMLQLCGPGCFVRFQQLSSKSYVVQGCSIGHVPVRGYRVSPVALTSVGVLPVFADWPSGWSSSSVPYDSCQLALRPQDLAFLLSSFLSSANCSAPQQEQCFRLHLGIQPAAGRCLSTAMSHSVCRFLSFSLLASFLFLFLYCFL